MYTLLGKRFAGLLVERWDISVRFGPGNVCVGVSSEGEFLPLGFFYNALPTALARLSGVLFFCLASCLIAEIKLKKIRIGDFLKV